MISPDQLHVVSVISNPVRYRSRALLHRMSQAHQGLAGVTQWVVEAVFGERPPEATQRANPNHLVVRCDSEIWLKENLINLAVRHLLPENWRYVMWMDADFEFVRPDWALEVVHALQHWRVVQPFSHAIDLGPESEVIGAYSGFAHDYNKGQVHDGGCYPGFHPGYAWAWRREAWEAVGGMIERAVCGPGDHHMACALIGRAELSLPPDVHPNYARMVLDWQHRAEVEIERDVGHVAGAIVHHFHGWKENRGYASRWNILRDTGFDPDSDLVADGLGLLHLARGRTFLRDQLRAYFRQRNEDAGRREWPC